MFPIWQAIMDTMKKVGESLKKKEVISLVKQRTKSIVEALETYQVL
jgi:hypothetical protein